MPESECVRLVAGGIRALKYYVLVMCVPCLTWNTGVESMLRLSLVGKAACAF